MLKSKKVEKVEERIDSDVCNRNVDDFFLKNRRKGAKNEYIILSIYFGGISNKWVFKKTGGPMFCI
jgi:hypothetical protein